MASSPLRGLLRVVPGIRRVTDQIEPYAAAWAEDTRAALASGRPLVAVLGDSTAQGVGASSHRRGWVGQVDEWLGGRTGMQWDVANWSRTGARVRDVVDDQLPELRAAARTPQLVLVAVGANDVFWGLHTGAARRAISELLVALPGPAVVAAVPAQGLAVRARRLNGHIRAEAAVAGVVVADVDRHLSGGRDRLASDGFHPNDRGYEEWAAAFRPAVEAALALPR